MEFRTATALSSLPKGFEAIASTENSPYATIQNASKDLRNAIPPRGRNTANKESKF